MGNDSAALFPTLEPVDITEITESLKASFVAWAVKFIMEKLILTAGLAWLGWPIIAPLAAAAIGYGISLLVESAEMQAFFLTTSMQKAAEASDYVQAVRAKNSLPDTVSREDFENAEKVEMEAFRKFVMVNV